MTLRGGTMYPPLLFCHPPEINSRQRARSEQRTRSIGSSRRSTCRGPNRRSTRCMRRRYRRTKPTSCSRQINVFLNMSATLPLTRMGFGQVTMQI